MGVLTAFLATWSRARDTFGAGQPPAGDRFDQSQRLRGLQATVESAAPGDGWTGRAAVAYLAANADHREVLAQLASLDRRLGAHVTSSSDAVTAGRDRLDAVRTWVLDAAAALPPAEDRERQLMPIVRDGLARVAAIVAASHDRLSTIGAEIHGLAGEYETLGEQRFAATALHADAPLDVPHEIDEPADAFVGDPRFGQWETVAPLPDGSHPPVTRHYRPFGDDERVKVGPTTGLYVPGKTWVAGRDAPILQGQEGYRFRIAGVDATELTRVVTVDGRPRVQRWLANVYEYQRNTSLAAGGPLAGLPPITDIDHVWKPITLPRIAELSAANPATTYYLPDGCGGRVEFLGGTPADDGLPHQPTMSRPR